MLIGIVYITLKIIMEKRDTLKECYCDDYQIDSHILISNCHDYFERTKIKSYYKFMYNQIIMFS